MMKNPLNAALIIVLCMSGCKDRGFQGSKTPASTPKPTATPTGSPQNPQNPNECLKQKAQTYNTVIVFDRSGSMLQTDPSLIRQQGALAFVQKMLEYKQANPAANINIATAAFSTTAFPGANGWVNLTPATTQKIAADIQQATNAPNGSTNYGTGLQVALSLFQQLPTTTPNPSTNGGVAVSTLNFLVFLTDGVPTDSRAIYLPILNQIVTTYQVAVLAMAVGNDFVNRGQTTVQEMALPTVGSPVPSHKGAYFRAQAPQDIATAWQQVFSAIASCN